MSTNVYVEEIKKIDIKEFRDLGFLQEANRQFFHPLGLALEVIVDGDNTILGGIWDYREDPEGMFFGNEIIKEEKIKHVEQLRDSKRSQRFIAAREYKYAVDENGLQIKV